MNALFMSTTEWIPRSLLRRAKNSFQIKMLIFMLICFVYDGSGRLKLPHYPLHPPTGDDYPVKFALGNLDCCTEAAQYLIIRYAGAHSRHR